MKRETVIAVLVFLLGLGVISCNENRDTQLVEFNKYRNFIEKTNQKDLNRVLALIARCGGTNNASLLNLKTVIVSLNENSRRQLNKVDELKGKAELEAFKEEVVHSIYSIKLSKELANHYSQTWKAISLNSLSAEEAKIVLKANIILIEKEMREKMLCQWAIDS